MKRNNYNWFIALLMYFVLAVVVNLVDGGLLFLFGVNGDMAHYTNGASLAESGLLAKYFIIGAATYAAWFTGCTLLSGRLMKRGIDL